MKAYKIMRKRYYEPGATVATTDINYGNRIRKCSPSQALAESAVDVCSQTNASFGEMIELIYQLQTNPGRIPLPSSLKPHHAERLEPVAMQAPVITESVFGTAFWETLYDRVRRDERPDCPSRLDSYFVFRDMETLGRFVQTHWPKKMADKVVCEVLLSDCHLTFDADTAILDAVVASMTYHEAAPHIRRYWDQEQTANPMIELLVQGKVALGSEVPSYRHSLATESAAQS